METKCYQCGLTNWPEAVECGRCQAALGAINERTAPFSASKSSSGGGGVKLIIILSFAVCACIGLYVVLTAGLNAAIPVAEVPANGVTHNSANMAVGVSSPDIFDEVRKRADAENKKQAEMYKQLQEPRWEDKSSSAMMGSDSRGKWSVNVGCVESRVAANGVRICSQFPSKR